MNMFEQVLGGAERDPSVDPHWTDRQTDMIENIMTENIMTNAEF